MIRSEGLPEPEQSQRDNHILVHAVQKHLYKSMTNNNNTGSEIGLGQLFESGRVGYPGLANIIPSAVNQEQAAKKLEFADGKV